MKYITVLQNDNVIGACHVDGKVHLKDHRSSSFDAQFAEAQNELLERYKPRTASVDMSTQTSPTDDQENMLVNAASFSLSTDDGNNRESTTSANNSVSSPPPCSQGKFGSLDPDYDSPVFFESKESDTTEADEKFASLVQHVNFLTGHDWSDSRTEGMDTYCIDKDFARLTPFNSTRW